MDDEAAIAAGLDEHAQRVVLPSWPVLGLAGADGEGFLGGVREQSEDGVVAVRFDYRTPDSAERVLVQTQPGRGRGPDLVGMTRAFRDGTDSGSPVSLSAGTSASDGDPGWVASEALVDGRPVPALSYVDGALTVWQVRVRSVTVVAAAWQVPLEELALRTVTDLTPFQVRRTLVVRQWLSRQPRS